MTYIPAIIRKKELQLKPFQAEAIKELKKAFSVHKRVILQAATAFGKTVVAAQIIKQSLGGS